MINPANFKTTNLLTNYAIKVMNEREDFAAEKIFTSGVVPAEAFSVFQYDRSHLRRVQTQKAVNAPADLIDYDGFRTTFTAKLHKLAAEINPYNMKDFDPAVADLKFQATQNITSLLLIDLEALVYSKINTTGNYASGLTTSLNTGTTTWADTGGDPVADSYTARYAVKAASGRKANTMATSEAVLETLRRHPSIVDRLKYTNGKTASNEDLKNLMGVDEIIVSSAQYNSAAEGAADTLGDIWGDSVLFFYKDPSDAAQGRTFGKLWIYDGWYTHEWTEDALGAAKRIEMIEMGWWYTPEFAVVESSSSAKTTAGYLIQNAI